MPRDSRVSAVQSHSSLMKITVEFTDVEILEVSDLKHTITMKMHLGESHFCEEFVHSAFRIKGKGSLRKSYLTIFLFVKYNLLLTSHPSLRHSWVQMNNTTNPCKNKRKIVIERWLSKQQTWKEKELQMLSLQKIKNKPLMKFFESASQMSQKYVTRDRRDTNTWESGDEYFL